MPEPPPRGEREMRRPAVAAREVLAVCEALKLERPVHLFAHGLGCAAALYFSELLEERERARERAAKEQREKCDQDLNCLIDEGLNEAAYKAAAKAAASAPKLQFASLTLASPYGSIEDLRASVRTKLRDFDEIVPLDLDIAYPATEGQE